MIKRPAACIGAAFTSSFAVGGEAAEKPTQGFKIGAVDWELTRPADPEALAVAARLGFDGLQVDLGDVEGMQKAHAQYRYERIP